MFVSGRDFVILGMIFQDNEGRLIQSGVSVEHPDCPPTKKYVRAQLHIGGWILTPDPDYEST